MTNEQDQVYIPVMNHEEQFSIWFADREVPHGWKQVGEPGTKDECLDYIEQIWEDMRPLSLREKIKNKK